MSAQSGFPRRFLLRGGLAATTMVGVGLSAASARAAEPGKAARRHAAARPKASEPRIYTTAEWDAQAPTSDIVIQDHVPTYIVVHHTAEPGNSEDYSLKHAKKICRDIQDTHIGQGWGDTGQQFTNSRGGFVLEGRHKSLETVRGGTQHVLGANVADHNSEIIGIENEGLYSTVDVPDALWDSLVPLVSWIASQYERPVKNILGHRDFNSTECPGDVLYGRLQELRDAVASALGTSSATPASWPLLRPGNTGSRVRAAQHLLRAKGFDNLPADGVFGTATRQAVAKLADTHHVQRHSCAACQHTSTDETGYLGSDIWPLLTPRTRAGNNSEVAKAVDTLQRAHGNRVVASGGTLSVHDWKRLLT